MEKWQYAQLMGLCEEAVDDWNEDLDADDAPNYRKGMSKYPTIILADTNPEIEDCTLFPAFVGLFAEFHLKDGTHFRYADVIAYEMGAFTLSVGDHIERDENGNIVDTSFTAIVPVSAIDTITYI